MQRADWTDLGSDLRSVGEEVRLQLRLARMDAQIRLHDLDRRIASGARRATGRAYDRAIDLARALIYLGGS